MHPYQGRPCTVCGKVYISFAQHIRQHPRCALPVVTKSEEVPPQASARTASDEILEELRAMMASDLADLRYQNGLDESMIGALKRKVTRWNEEMASAPRLCFSCFRVLCFDTLAGPCFRVSVFWGMDQASCFCVSVFWARPGRVSVFWRPGPLSRPVGRPVSPHTP